MATEQTEFQAFMPISDELLQEAPADSWIAVSADHLRIVASGTSLDAVMRKAEELGERDFVISKTPPAGAVFVF